MQVTTINSGWEFRSQDRGPGYGQPNVRYVDWLPASVPGHVHVDLVRHGIIPDPFRRRFEFGAQWVDSVGWNYRTTFEWSPKEGAPRRILRFAGLDTVCSIFLNDQFLASHDSMFLPLEVDVTDKLRTGPNELRVEFDSAVKVGMARRDAYFAKEGLDRTIDFFDERAFVRKAGYMFAWDWGPRLVSCGLWQPVELLEFAGRITSVHWQQHALEDGRFRVTPSAEVEGAGELSFTLNGETKGVGESFEFSPELWWPNGYGAQPLYDAEARLTTGDKQKRKLGFRTIDLDQSDGKFQFVVNGVPIFARGANWIPNDSFPSRVTAVDYASQIESCRDLNMNMLRVWGGGIYETEAFYDACDELGLLVWQDFLFACSYYPDDLAMQAVVREEAEYQVARLRDRASLALWCGNNENLTMWQGKWGAVHPSRYYGEPLYNQILPSVVAQLDPSRPYTASSPIGPEPDANGNGAGDQHYWDVWHGKGDWKFYADSGARFCSEFGFASACSPALWQKTLDDLTLGGQEHLSHDKTGKPWSTFTGYVELHYPPAVTLDEWTYRSQLNQRDAMRFGIEHYRRSTECAGTLVWQFNDCWPVQSWALQDYDRVLKVAGWEMARLCAPLMVSVLGGEVWLVNDTRRAADHDVRVRLVSTLTGEETFCAIYAAVTGPGERLLVTTLSLEGVEVSSTALQVSLVAQPHSTRWSLLAEPKETSLTACRIERVASDEFRVTGFACDLVAWQGDKWLVSPSHGNTAVTACDEIVRFTPVSDAPVRFMSLAGEHPSETA